MMRKFIISEWLTRVCSPPPLWQVVVCALIIYSWAVCAAFGLIKQWADSPETAIECLTYTWGVTSAILSAMFGFIYPYVRDNVQNSAEAASLGHLYRELLVVELGNIVTTKSTRFRDVLRKLQNGEISHNDVFDKITQPDIQIKELLTKLGTMLCGIDKTADVKCKICLFAANYTESPVCNDNNKPKTHALFNVFKKKRRLVPIVYKSLYSVPDYEPEHSFPFGIGGVGRCAEDKSPLLIEDIAAEIKKKKSRYVIFEAKESNNHCSSSHRGSLCCYPIENNAKIDLVISVKIDKARFLKRGNIRLIERCFLEPIATRLLLEYRLEQIKKSCQSVNCK